MGHRSKNAPRHGSLRYMPRKRAVRSKGRIRNWPNINGDPKFLGFAGFKAGMTHIAFIEDQESSPFYGKELMKAVTIIETPPLVMFGIRLYKKSEYGLSCTGELLAKELKKELLDAFNLPTKGLKRRENTIMTRISHEDLQIMNALVELGIFKSISETAAFLIHDSIVSKNDYYKRILKIFKEIKAKKLEAVATLLESVKEEREASRIAGEAEDGPDEEAEEGDDEE